MHLSPRLVSARQGVGWLLLAACVVPGSGLTPGGTPAQAAGQGYTYLAPGYHQQVVAAPGSSGDAYGHVALEGAAVREDGALVVATSVEHQPFAQTSSTQGADPGYLHVLSSGTGALSDSNRLGRPLDLSGDALRDGLLYGIVATNPHNDGPDPPTYDVLVVDPFSRTVVRKLTEWWIAELQIAVDPVTKQLVMLGECGPCAQQASNRGHVAGGVQLVDPVTGRRTELVPGPKTTEEAVTRPFGDALALSPEGATIYVGYESSSSYGIDAFNRSGRRLFHIATPQSVFALAFGTPGTCTAGLLYYQLHDGSVWVVKDPGPESVAGAVVATGLSTTGYGRSMLFDQRGNLLALTAQGVIRLTPPTAPAGADSCGPRHQGRPAKVPEVGDHTTHAQGAGAPPPSAQGSSSALGGPGLGSPGGAPAAQSQPGTQAATSAQHQGATQTSVGSQAASQAAMNPNVAALADLTEEEPVYGLSAAPLRRPSPVVFFALAGLTVVMGAASVVASDKTGSLMPTTRIPRRRTGRRA